MFYVSSEFKTSIGRGNTLLLIDDWDDWFTYSTKYRVYYMKGGGDYEELGNVKIGQFAMEKGQRRPQLPPKFESLSTKKFFSLGQSPDYYKLIYDLDLQDKILGNLADVVLYNDLFRRARTEDVFETSLTRSVRETRITGEFRRILSGAAPLSEFDFSYTGPSQLSTEHKPVKLDFQVTPESDPPSNIHVLIGRNGVGKSFLLNSMTKALLSPGSNVKDTGLFEDQELLRKTPFQNLVSVTFSAFDKFERIPDQKMTPDQIGYSYIGLKTLGGSQNSASELMNLDMLSEQFSLSLNNIVTDQRLVRWQRALDMLESDPVFKVAKISELADEFNDGSGMAKASKTFRNLSSGHKIVLLIVTRLVEVVDEKTLILMDEPEAHLHPPLLSALVRALSDLFNNRNAVAIIATHSPVVLQEVPSQCTWLLERYNTLMTVSRPEEETFAENVGILTHRIFGLEVEESGFYNLLRDAAIEHQNYEEIISQFEERVGSEGKALIRSVLFNETKKRKKQ